MTRVALDLESTYASSVLVIVNIPRVFMICLVAVSQQDTSR